MDNDISKLCRICVLEHSSLVSVNQTFESGGEKSTLDEIFNDCSPVKIHADDGYPQKFCLGCLSELLKVYDFRHKCRKSVVILHRKFKDVRSKSKKRQAPHDGSLSPKPSCSKVPKAETNIDFENIIVKNEIIFQESDGDEDEAYAIDEDEEAEETLWMEELEGEEANASPKASTSEEQVTIKVKDDANSAKVVAEKKSASHIILTSPRSEYIGEYKKVVAQGSSKLVYVPPVKEKPIALPEKGEHPDLGMFKINIMRGYKNSSHVVYEANGFLYVNTRNTPHRRYLRCSTSKNCPGKACIDVKPHDEMEEYLYVYKLHSHPKDTLHITKLKFLEEMRCIAAGANYSPKQVYEIALKKYPDLRTIMPYATLSSRLYRLSSGSNNQNQMIATLTKFGKYLNQQKPTKYCMTQEGLQFFQEALIDEEHDKCSLIFANTSLIESMSWSNELFIDTSFIVNFENGVNYQFLTICIAINEHRFPIYFVLTNNGCQEEYVKVLTLFKDKYAPSLHPEEIATDFDAALFKAVLEVYNHSTISGSLIHYIFHIYKQCNVEDIIKKIELKTDCMKMQSYLFSLPILPPHLIALAVAHLKNEAEQHDITEIFQPIFDYVEDVWIRKVTPQVISSFCNMSAVNENIFNSYKKIRDIVSINKKYGFFDFAEKLLAIEDWVSTTYHKVLYGEKLPRQTASSKYTKVLDKLWQPNHIEKSGFLQFFESVCPLIEKMTELIWIWGFYSYEGTNQEDLITPRDYFGTETNEQVLVVEQANEDEAEAEAEADTEDEESETQVYTLQLLKPGIVLQKR